MASALVCLVSASIKRNQTRLCAAIAIWFVFIFELYFAEANYESTAFTAIQIILTLIIRISSVVLSFHALLMPDKLDKFE